MRQRTSGIGGYYNNGPFQARYRVRVQQEVRGPDLDDWAFTVTGAWNFGIARIAGVYERLDYDTADGQPEAQFLWRRRSPWPIGPGSVYAFWGRADDGKGGGRRQRVGGPDQAASGTGADQWEISYTYPLSKRTQVYAGYVKLDNDSRAAYKFNINAYTINTTCLTEAVCPNGANGKPDGLVTRHDPPVLSSKVALRNNGSKPSTGAFGRPFFCGDAGE